MRARFRARVPDSSCTALDFGPAPRHLVRGRCQVPVKIALADGRSTDETNQLGIAFAELGLFGVFRWYNDENGRVAGCVRSDFGRKCHEY
jgi:hypothetical protein